MSKPLYLTLFIVAIALAYASSQTAGGSSSMPNQKGEPQNSSKAGQTAQSSQTENGAPQSTNQSTQVPGGATDASGGGVVGAAGSAMEKTQVPETPGTPSGVAIPDADLQSQIQNALSKEPTLSGDTVNVTVSPESVEMAGSVTTAREKQTATRIVQSYAGNKKVLSHLMITGHNKNAAPGVGSQTQKSTTGSDVSTRPPASGRPPQ